MAVLFDSSKHNQTMRAVAAVTDVPFTFACWFNVTDQPWQGLIWVGYKSVASIYSVLGIYGTGYGHKLFLQARYAATLGEAFSTINWTENTWHHGCAVFKTTTSREIYLDGGNKGTNSTSVAVNSYSRTAIGFFADSTPSGYVDGKMAEAAIWDTDLTAVEVAILAKGYSPLFVRPQNLVAYWPLIRPYESSEHCRKLNDLVGPHILSCWEADTADLPVAAPHCRIIHPAPAQTLLVAGQLGITPLLLRAIEKY